MSTAKQIRQGLKKFHGSFTELARRQGCTREWVRNVLDEKYDDPELLLAAALLWRELEQQRKEALDKAIALAADAEQYALAFA